MQQALRPYVTAGVAVLGAGMIAVTPMTAASVVAQSPALRLTAGEGFFDTWQNVFDTATANATTLYNNFALAPAVGLQQMIVNQQALWGEVADGTKSFDEALTQIQDNMAMLGSAFGLVGADEDTVGIVFDHTLDGDLIGHGTIADLLPGMLPEDADIDPDQVTDILHFLSSPMSAMLIGSMGPSISPLVAMVNSFTEISDAMTGETPDFEAAFNGMLNIPANMVNGFLNGADLDLGALVPAINDAGLLPEGMELTGLEFAFGGMLSPGVSGAGDGGSYAFEDGTEVSAVGGSIFNSIGLSMSGAPIVGDLELDGHAIGPIAAMQVWSQTMGALLGDEWDGKGAEQVPPLFGLDPIGLDDAGSSVASLFGDLLSDI